MRTLKALCKKPTQLFISGARFFALMLLGAYRTLLSPHFGGTCRFEPSCSAYAVESYQKHSLVKATQLTAARLCRCHPFGPFGFDPVPSKEEAK